ncbi:MAG: hypothetical protein LBG68_04995 [Coriobacteriales bacterium]|jgi:hypothetical protein|nr:hypothetical protein [Coriobacteriales bacterium]
MDNSTNISESPGSRSANLQLLLGAVCISCLMLLVVLGINGLSDRVEVLQTEWLEQSVQRSAIQCFIIEGSFPTTEQGVDYLREHYGLNIDQQRYVVYYESMGANLLPQVKVIAIQQGPESQDIEEQLGFSPDKQDVGNELP